MQLLLLLPSRAMGDLAARGHRFFRSVCGRALRAVLPANLASFGGVSTVAFSTQGIAPATDRGLASDGCNTAGPETAARGAISGMFLTTSKREGNKKQIKQKQKQKQKQKANETPACRRTEKRSAHPRPKHRPPPTRSSQNPQSSQSSRSARRRAARLRRTIWPPKSSFVCNRSLMLIFWAKCRYIAQASLF